MTDTKEARPSAGTSGRTEDNFITHGLHRQRIHITDFLAPGAENAVSKADLMAATGLKDRELRLLVAAERRAGHIILTDCVNGGYYLPAHSNETISFIRSMRRRSRETAIIADATERALMAEAGQECFGGI